MSRMVMLALVGGLALAGCKLFSGPSEAYEAYVKFAEACSRGQTAAAQALAANDVVRDAVAQRSKKRNPRGIGFGTAAARVGREIRGDLVSTRHELVEEHPEGGTSTIIAKFTECYSKGKCVTQDHKVFMQKGGDGWKVVTFLETKAAGTR